MIKINIDEFENLIKEDNFSENELTLLRADAITCQNNVFSKDVMRLIDEVRKLKSEKEQWKVASLEWANEISKLQYEKDCMQRKLDNYRRAMKRIKFAPVEYSHKIVDEELKVIEK